jgi:hypothetical protein
LAVRASAAANNLLLRLACPQAAGGLVLQARADEVIEETLLAAEHESVPGT